MDPHLAALQRLALAGWLGVPIGDPSDPSELLYTKTLGGVEESLLVRAHDDAVAFRVVGGRRTQATEGTVSDVVAAVLDWPSLIVTR
ncbi:MULTISPECIES: hypothetical protein [unclassified Crossiella]|uniref:hypothetical protein n=1 Tax=unclassified Crossiella TaxID=2620835 RepID=UPI001FFE91AA|nr:MULTISPECIES: hypothetical protein [unclassified Crossiella]MCK2241231.1 hypothetical protein [Crossiella sp. S99.2]MCK2253625.1 hypothetical protein [Crossiella sp. S99.1]